MAMAGFTIFLLCSLGLLGTSLAASAYQDPHCNGRQVIVQLFEWTWNDIARECVDYLGPMGYCGVEVSPPNEHIVYNSFPLRPWWERYQPVSYELTSRSGNETEFRNMVNVCKSAGVRIFVITIMNHMAGGYSDYNGTAGNTFDWASKSFPAVPYTKENFNTIKCQIQQRQPYTDRDCATDTRGSLRLNTTQRYVQEKISGYLNSLIDIGVAGFKVSDARAMWPQDLRTIQMMTKSLPEGGRPFFYQYIGRTLGSSVSNSEYFNTGYVEEYEYGGKLKDGMEDFSILKGLQDIESGVIPSSDAMVSVDDHVNQRAYHKGGLSFKQPELYKRAVAFNMAYDYGFVRTMSSYRFNGYSDGPPHNPDYSIKKVGVADSGACTNGWVCEHRWNPIGRMVFFRNAVAGEAVTNWNYKNRVLSFNRGRKGFFAMAKYDFNVNINTGMPKGKYCDLVSRCTKTIDVDSNGMAAISPAHMSEPFVAIVAMKDQPWNQVVARDAVPTTNYIEADYRRTVILIERSTNPGEDLFIQGGIDHGRKTGCTKSQTPNPCSIPIRHINPGPDSHYDKVTAWSRGDNYLDWNGVEPGQGTYYGDPAKGTPAVWTTSSSGQAGYHRYNQYGDHYWLVEVDMDCSKTMDTYFEFKVYLNGWEQDIAGTSQCRGDSPGTLTFDTINHVGRCGYLNVFHYNNQYCEINEFAY